MIDPVCDISYHGHMSRMRAGLGVGLALLLSGCGVTGRAVARVPQEQRLEALYGHRMDIATRPHEPPRNIQWEEERLQVHVRVGRYLEAHPATPPAVVEALQHQDVVTGLTKEQVQLLWGPPDRVRERPPRWWRRNKTTGEVWYYRLPWRRWHRPTYDLYFHDGILEHIVAR